MFIGTSPITNEMVSSVSENLCRQRGVRGVSGAAEDCLSPQGEFRRLRKKCPVRRASEELAVGLRLLQKRLINHRPFHKSAA
jgi:hypothetical protein